MCCGFGFLSNKSFARFSIRKKKEQKVLSVDQSSRKRDLSTSWYVFLFSGQHFVFKFIHNSISIPHRFSFFLFWVLSCFCHYQELKKSLILYLSLRKIFLVFQVEFLLIIFSQLWRDFSGFWLNLHSWG